MPGRSGDKSMARDSSLRSRQPRLIRRCDRVRGAVAAPELEKSARGEAMKLCKCSAARCKVFVHNCARALTKRSPYLKSHQECPRDYARHGSLISAVALRTCARVIARFRVFLPSPPTAVRSPPLPPPSLADALTGADLV